MTRSIKTPAPRPIAHPAADQGMAELQKARFSERLWAKDAALFKADPGHQKIIRNSLGWLHLPEAMAISLGPIRSFAADAAKEGLRTAVVLGMGGSSLSCEVFRRCFALHHESRLDLRVLDSTNPGSVRRLESSLDLKKTLFLVSSKSGGTIEPNCMLEYFFAKAAKASGHRAARQFVAITDPGTSLEKSARRRHFRKVFLNPPDIGGRYSALSYFGLVPAALMGIDVAKLLDRARAASKNSELGLRLGAALGVLAREGRDKMTLSLSPELEAFGLWVEQLVAESTGKEGTGILPACEPVEKGLGKDRVFVRIAATREEDDVWENRSRSLENAGHPVLRLELPDVYGLGAQFFHWEIATAAAGFLLGVNPFDQPDVQSAKDQTKALLGGLHKGALPKETASFRAGGLAAYADDGLIASLKAARGSSLPLSGVLRAHLGRVKAGDYVSILAFVEESPEKTRMLESIRATIRKSVAAPVTLGYGPRYLHSTGQLYKGGPATGVFLLVTEPEGTALPIPGERFTFGVLHQAQARGDFEAMRQAGRRVLRLDLSRQADESLQSLVNALG